nr:hypothetical protein [Tanacetum cinerariifolium]
CSEVTSHSLGIGKRFLALDSVISSDSVSRVMLKCSYPILSEFSADACLNPVVVLDWFLRQEFLQKSFQETFCFEHDDLHYH